MTDRATAEEENGGGAGSVRGDSAHSQRGVWHYLWVGISGALFMSVLGLMVFVIVVPAVTGATPFTVLTGSMQPGYPPGTLIITRPIDANDVHPGDVITYQLESGKAAVVTHRVTQRLVLSDGTLMFITQGDANNSADVNPVIPAQIRGKLWYAIPYLGWVNNVVSGSTRSWLIPIIAVLLFGYAGWMAISGIRDRDRAKKRRADAHPPSSERSIPPP